MGYREAIDTGIRIEKLRNGDTAYYPYCHRCGRETFSLNYIKGFQYTCNTCKHKDIRFKESRSKLGKFK